MNICMIDTASEFLLLHVTLMSGLLILKKKGKKTHLFGPILGCTIFV